MSITGLLASSQVGTSLGFIYACLIIVSGLVLSTMSLLLGMEFLPMTLIAIVEGILLFWLLYKLRLLDKFGKRNKTL